MDVSIRKMLLLFFLFSLVFSIVFTIIQRIDTYFNPPPLQIEYINTPIDSSEHIMERTEKD